MAILIFPIILAVPGTKSPPPVLWSAVAHEPYGSVWSAQSEKLSSAGAPQNIRFWEVNTTQVQLFKYPNFLNFLGMMFTQRKRGNRKYSVDIVFWFVTAEMSVTFIFPS